MSGWGFNSIKYYLLGHPLIWWGSAVSVALFVIIVIVYLARGRKDWPDPGKEMKKRG